ncbi:hypothetical protein RhiirA5_403904 [Rhizophagus irregularis]|uniref:Uncharacterized protein n=2 Tax=Rhizophagus irregularis TaxID=588596 RepID=A0A2N0NVF8_9GLOM|nr:hypothetical protein RhiirA5_403904 [Rhizophagus irregularis]
MRCPISFTYIIIATICSLMNIIALMPATKAYEVLLRNWGGQSNAECCVWQEDAQHNFITYIPQSVPNEKHHYYYCSNCATFDGMDKEGADLRNGILTYRTLDDTTTYWADMVVSFKPGNNHIRTNRGGDSGYNNHTCFHVFGDHNEARLDEAPYEECQKIRDSN